MVGHLFVESDQDHLLHEHRAHLLGSLQLQDRQPGVPGTLADQVFLDNKGGKGLKPLCRHGRLVCRALLGLEQDGVLEGRRYEVLKRQPVRQPAQQHRRGYVYIYKYIYIQRYKYG